MKMEFKMRKAVATLLMMFAAFVLHAQDTTATSSGQFCMITTKNGTTVSGMMTERANGNVKVNDAMLGTVNIEESKIESIKIVETGKEYQFQMSDGRVIRGTVLRQNPSVITLKTDNVGEISITINNIKDFAIGDRGFTFQGETFDHASRYLFAPSAIPLRRGEGYYQNIMVLMNGAHVGITDRFSVGGGVMIPFGFFGTVKYGIQLDKNVHVAVGGIGVTTLFGIGVGMGCGFGSVTVGNRYTNISLTGGYGGVASGSGWEVTKRPIANVSGMVRLAPSVSLVTENWFIPTVNYNSWNGTTTESYYPLYSLGFRLGAGHSSFDVAALSIGSYAEGEAIVIPYLAYAYRFTSKNMNNKRSK